MPSDLEDKGKTPITTSFPSDMFSSRRRSRRIWSSTGSSWSLFHSVCVLALALLLTTMYFYVRRDPVPKHDLYLGVQPPAPTSKLKPQATPPPRLKKSLVLASYSSQNTSWLDSVPSDWDVARMMMDDADPNHKYTVPRNQGRESMAYLTYIIDNYNKFPDVAVFIHGHFRSWHQPETITSKIRALNISAVQEEGYVSLRCKDSEGCAEGEGLRYKEPPYASLGLIPHIWSVFFPVGDPVSGIYQAPELIRYKCCAQFAVSREVVHARTLAEWKNIRQPLVRGADDYEGLQDLNFMDGGVDWNFGMIYEAFWPIFMGKSADHCPSEDYCQKVHFSDAITCDFYAENLWAFLDDPHMNCTDIFDGPQPYYREEKEPEEDESNKEQQEQQVDEGIEEGIGETNSDADSGQGIGNSGSEEDDEGQKERLSSEQENAGDEKEEGNDEQDQQNEERDQSDWVRGEQ